MSDQTAKHLDREVLLKIISDSGAEYEELSKYDRVGPKKGPHLMVSRARKTALVYGYGFQLPVDGVTNFSPEERREQKLGGITLRLETDDVERAYEAFRLLVGHVVAEGRP